MKRKYTLALSGALVLAWLLWSGVFAVEPVPALAQSNGQQVGLVSTSADCVAVPTAAVSSNVTATVRLAWSGQIERAYLVLTPNGSEGEHSLYVNGQRVGGTAVRPGVESCQPYFPERISISPDLLVNGENEIVLTNDAAPGDGWTAAQIHLEIQGILMGPPVALLESPSNLSSLGLGALAILTASVPSTYDPPWAQVVYYQQPTAYSGNPTPLLIVLHGKGGTGLGIITLLTAEADARGWLLAAPDMHNNFVKNNGTNALAWVGAQHDVIDTINYMIAHYNVDKTRIYVTGGSMGGQTTTMMAAKYPDIFAAAVPWKPLTDLGEWHNELGNTATFAPNPADPFNDLPGIRQEVSGTPVGGTPTTIPFEYARRSPRNMARNIRLLPFKIWHDSDDIFVSPHHSQDLKSAIDSFSPVTPVILNLVPSGAEDCPASVIDFRDGIPGNGLPIYDLEHCYNPNPDDVFDFLQGFTRNAQPPPALNIRTDEEKSYYWLNIDQTSSAHWTEVNTSYSLANKTVTATVVDTATLTLGFNLGSTPIAGPAGINQAGLGLPATTYLVKKGGVSFLSNYAGTGYFNVALTPGQTSLTISAIGLQVSANPPSLLPGPTTSITITAVVKDQLNNPVPNATQIVFTTTHGTFQASGSATHITTISGGQGQAVTILKTNGTAQVTASVQNVSGTVSIFDASSPPTNSTFLPLIKK